MLFAASRRRTSSTASGSPARARLAGLRALRRPQLGGLERARRRAADRPRRHARDRRRRATGIATARPAVRAASSSRRSCRVARPHVHRRPLRVGRHRRLPAAGRPGLEQPPLGLGLRERRWPSTSSPPTASSCTPTRTRTPTCTGPRAAPAPAFFGVVTRFHLRTYPRAPMFHDTRDVPRSTTSSRCSSWLHDVLPTLDVAVEPVIAATRLRDRRRSSCCCTRRSSPTTRRRPTRLLAPLDAVPAEPLEHVRGPTTIAEENAAQALQNPEGHRYCADCQWTNARRSRARARCCATICERAADPSTRSRSGTAGRRPRDAARHGVLARGQRLPRDLRDLDRPGGRRAPPRLGPRPPRARWPSRWARALYLGDSDFTRRPDRFMAEANLAAACARSARARDPDGRFVATWL